VINTVEPPGLKLPHFSFPAISAAPSLARKISRHVTLAHILLFDLYHQQCSMAAIFRQWHNGAARRRWKRMKLKPTNMIRLDVCRIMMREAINF